MAKIEDFIAQIPDERLRKAIAAEVREWGNESSCRHQRKNLENFRINLPDALRP